jgi:hypothetical protein
MLRRLEELCGEYGTIAVAVEALRITRQVPSSLLHVVWKVMKYDLSPLEQWMLLELVTRTIKEVVCPEGNSPK